MEAIYEKWEQILQFVKEEHDISQVSFDTWLKPLEICTIKDGKLFGVAIEGFGQGFGGDIGVMVGFNVNDDSLINIDITTHKETPGLGSRVSEDSFKKQFEGGEIDAISGATVSSNGAVLAINDAGNQYKALKKEIINTWNSGAKNEFLQGIHQRAVE